MILDCAFGEVQGGRDLSVAVAAGQQPQDLDLAAGQRFGTVEPVKSPGSADQSAQQGFGDPGMDGALALVNRSDGADQLVEGYVLEQIATRAGPDRVDDGVVVIEGGEDQHRGWVWPEG